MLVCCSTQHVEKWAGLHIPTSELPAYSLVLLFTVAPLAHTTCAHCGQHGQNACSRLANNACSNAHSNTCSNARNSFALMMHLHPRLHVHHGILSCCLGRRVSCNLMESWLKP
eukprot:1156890-Pelagomonas_calceolata.AAC.2